MKRAGTLVLCLVFCAFCITACVPEAVVSGYLQQAGSPDEREPQNTTEYLSGEDISDDYPEDDSVDSEINGVFDEDSEGDDIFNGFLSKQSDTLHRSDVYEIALIDYADDFDDISFSRCSWECIVQYASENNISHKYYIADVWADDSALDAIDLAVQNGARVILASHFLFEVPVFIAQERYPGVYFIMLDGIPHNDDYDDYKVSANTVAVIYAEEQAGFLAGYAAVMDGYRNLGFIGGMAVPAIVRYGFGFV